MLEKLKEDLGKATKEKNELKEAAETMARQLAAGDHFASSKLPYM